MESPTADKTSKAERQARGEGVGRGRAAPLPTSILAERQLVDKVNKLDSVFHLEIMTPERMFLSDDVEALNITTTDGRMEILKGHSPITAPLTVGVIQVKRDGKWREAFQSEGFLEVNSEGVFVFAQAVEWPEDIDAARAKEAEHRLTERMRQQRSMIEYQWSKIALARAAARLRVSQQRLHID